MIFAKVRFVFDNIKTMILFNFILMKAKFELRFLIRKKNANWNLQATTSWKS
jgi:hypothetical protein